MSYGALPGDTVAAGSVNAATPAVLTSRLNVSSVLRNSAGNITVTLAATGAGGIDKTMRAVTATAGTTGLYTVVDEAAGTDTTLVLLSFNAAGVATDSIVHFKVTRCEVG